ncbi:MAG: MarR family transcriptional regulator [Actinobacteria bacterium]|nr:MarR family transcriptional regulator [Actinomycetota bacterium]
MDSTTDVVMAASRVLVGIAARSVPESARVTLPQFRALVLLDAAGDMKVNSLAARLGVDPSSATRLCDRLVAKRLIRRRPAEGSRREVRILLTARGAALVAGAISARRRAVAAILARMTAPDRDRLAVALGPFLAAGGDEGGDARVLAWSHAPAR